MKSIKLSHIKLKGLTITELLIDLVLSTMVITSVFGLYINYKQRYSYQTDTVFLFENAKSAYSYIKDDIQIAGYYGCLSDPSSIEYALTPTYDYQLANKISAYEATNTGLNSSINLSSPTAGWSPTVEGQAADISADSGSDILTTRFVDTVPVGITNSATTGGSLDITGIQSSVNINDILLITDCIRTVVLQVDSLTTDMLTPSNSVGNLNAGAELYRININTYYIKTSSSVPGLYKYSNSTEELLVPYVENMQLVFGQDLDDDNITNQFLTANNLISPTNNDIINAYVSFIIKSVDKHASSQTLTSFEIFEAPDGIQTTTTVTTGDDSYIRKSFDFDVNFPNTGGI